MLGRKGVLISDPSVAEMTDAQWLFEGYALRKAEERAVDQKLAQMEGLKHLLVGLLGLDLVKPAAGTGEEFIPLSVMTGQPEVMRQILEERNIEQGAADALTDQSFDDFSMRLARGEDPYGEDDLVPDDLPPTPTPERSGPVTIRFDED